MRDDQMHETWRELERTEVDYTLNHDFMTENPQTEVSMLAPHRVKPYHFKGFNQQQKDNVHSIRDQQIVDFKNKQEQEAEEERQRALQMEINRRKQVLMDRQMKRDHRNVAENYLSVQLDQQADHKQKWRDPYYEKHDEEREQKSITHKGNLKL